MGDSGNQLTDWLVTGFVILELLFVPGLVCVVIYVVFFRRP